MKAARLVEVGRIELVDLPKPEPGKGEVRLRILAAGVCGSDLHAFQGTHPFVHPPIVMGHEMAARVDKVGEGVTSFEEGDLVTVEPNITCGTCFNCRLGRYNVCQNLKVIGCVGYDGAQSEFVVISQEKVFKVPSEWSVEQTVMVEPIAVGVHAVRQSNLRRGQGVLVIGAGIIGLSTLLALKEAGAGRVIVSDLMSHRLEVAKNLGADITVNVKEERLEEIIGNVFLDKAVDLIMDCVGTQKTLDTAMSVARKGTRIVMVGVPEGRLLVDMANLQDREMELVGTLMYTKEDYQGSIDIIAKRAEAVSQLVTHRFPLSDVMQAFQLAASGQEECLKVLVLP